MSAHHRAQKWTTHSPKIRIKIKAMLPLPCIECGNPVMPDMKWHVGHKTAAARGGKPTIANTGPAHAACNLRAGGKLGASIVNSRRQASQDIREW